MKINILTSIFTLFIFSSLFSQPKQQFEVLKHRGSILNTSTQEELKKGSQYIKSDKLEFQEASCRLAVLDQKKSVFIVRPRWQNDKWISLYQEIPYKLQGRDGVINSSIELVNHISEDTSYLVVGDECKIEISPYFFKMNQDSFFYIRYYWQQDTINKKLLFEGDQLILSKNELFSAKYFADERYGKDTIIIIPSGEISRFELRCRGANSNRVFFDPSQPDHKQIRQFLPMQLQFLDDSMIFNEVSFFTETFAREENKDWIDRLHAYLQEVFEGKIENANLKTWLTTYGFIKD